MTNTMTVEQVKCLVKGKGSKIATVSFIKADGSIRTVNGLFKPTSKMVGSDREILLFIKKELIRSWAAILSIS